jgi:single stranded DNA-binding protein
VSRIGVGANTKGYGSSWIFEPRLTCANALRRVQYPAFSLGNSSGSCDLGILVDHAAESIKPQDPDAGWRNGLGDHSQWRRLTECAMRRIQQDGEWRDGDTSFLKVNVWRGQAEHLANSLAKGDRVMVTGRLRQRTWETLEGEKRSVAEVEADEVGASLKFATAKVERATERGSSDRSRGRSGRPAAATLATHHLLDRFSHAEAPRRGLGFRSGAPRRRYYRDRRAPSCH